MAGFQTFIKSSDVRRSPVRLRGRFRPAMSSEPDLSPQPVAPQGTEGDSVSPSLTPVTAAASSPSVAGAAALPSAASPTGAERALALLEVLLCSDVPTQLALGAILAVLGFAPANDQLRLNYVAALAIGDSVLLLGLIAWLVHARGERLRDLLLGRRPLLSEMRAGIPLIFLAFAIAVTLLLVLQAVAPWLRTVPHNPLQDLVSTPRDALVFGLVLIVAGGLREEVQRAFLLHRFERWLGGAKVGLVITSVAFGLGHFLQGADAAVATAVLGAFWGTVYLRRRSVGATFVSHAGFNLVQVLQFLLLSAQAGPQ